MTLFSSSSFIGRTYATAVPTLILPLTLSLLDVSIPPNNQGSEGPLPTAKAIGRGERTE